MDLFKKVDLRKGLSVTANEYVVSLCFCGSDAEGRYDLFVNPICSKIGDEPILHARVYNRDAALSLFECTLEVYLV